MDMIWVGRNNHRSLLKANSFIWLETEKVRGMWSTRELWQGRGPPRLRWSRLLGRAPRVVSRIWEWVPARGQQRNGSFSPSKKELECYRGEISGQPAEDGKSEIIESGEKRVLNPAATKHTWQSPPLDSSCPHVHLLLPSLFDSWTHAGLNCTFPLRFSRRLSPNYSKVSLYYFIHIFAHQPKCFSTCHSDTPYSFFFFGHFWIEVELVYNMYKLQL